MSTPVTKAPVDVKAIMKKASEKTAEVKTGTAKVQATVDTYRKIPGYPKYEINSKNVVRNADTKMAQTMKKGTGKYYLLNAAGERKLISLADILAKLPKAAPAKADKPTKEKAPPAAVITELNEKQKEQVKKITALEVPRFVKTYKLNKMGIDKDVIAKLLGEVKFNVLRDLRHIRKGKKVVPADQL